MTIAECYAILGLGAGADQAQIKQAFRKKALQLHPDQGGDADAFRRLQEAFEYLLTHPAADEPDIAVGFAPYDPFDDPDYAKHTYFAPENDHIADFERSVRAQGCSYCNGRGYVGKLVDPSKGWLGHEERFCRCQIVKL